MQDKQKQLFIAVVIVFFYINLGRGKKQLWILVQPDRL